MHQLTGADRGRTVRNLAAPNLPLPPLEYNRGYLDQLTNVLRLFFTSVTNAINAPKPHGSFHDTATQTNPVADEVNLISFDSTSTAHNTAIGETPTRIYVAETGVYDIQFSLQLDKDNAAEADVYIWLRVNGFDVPYSASKIVLKGSSAEVVAAWDFMIPLQATDYIELAWASSNTDVYILARAASSPVPAIPSAILTIMWVSNVVV